MGDSEKGKALVDNAYALATPGDSVAYYRALAATYDGDFIDALGWSFPQTLAAAYRQEAKPDDLPVADIGCGTGIVAEALGLDPAAIDGMDISPEMLAIAAAKGRYGRLFEIDLTGDLEAIRNGYGAVLSAGTFTHGHLGPEVLANLVQIARPGGLFVIGVNKVHFAAKDFRGTLAALGSAGRITPPGATETRMYDRDGHAHSGDRAVILTFRRR